jgi:hypothetical protein
MLDSERPFGEHLCAEQSFVIQLERLFAVNIERLLREAPANPTQKRDRR